jgi:phosphatidylglycerol---prolipoprotein diacylglyceryl transferase
MIPDTLHIGPIPLHLFGICLALAFVAAGWVVGDELARRGFDREAGGRYVTWAAVGGIIGARLWVVFSDWPAFVRDPLSFLLTGGGFVFYGGLLGGTIAVSLLTRRLGIPFMVTADITAPAVAIGQSVGRWGCQLSGDGDWGTRTTGWWGMQYPYAVACDWPCDCTTGQCVWPADVFVHPAPIYESVLYLALFLLLRRVAARRLPAGTVFGWYLVLSAVARFTVETVRINPRVAFGWSEAQIASAVLVVLGAGLLMAKRGWRTVAA